MTIQTGHSAGPPRGIRVEDNGIGRQFRQESEALMETLTASLAAAIRGTDERIALPPGATDALEGFYEPLPETGSGAAAGATCPATCWSRLDMIPANRRSGRL